MTSGVYPRKFQSMSDRFWPKVIVSDGCWIWTGGTTSFGYGTIYNGNFDNTLRQYAKIGAHRVSYEIHHGKIPHGLCVLHKCDVPACVNPSHLFLGTKRENMLDKISKDRCNLTTKLTESDVIEIRLDNGTQRAIALKYGVCQATISMIKTGFRRSGTR